MRRLMLLIFVFSVLPGGAQLLWRISGNGLEKPSYLFGTYHVASFSEIDSICCLRQVIGSVDNVYGEVIAADMLNADTLVYMTRRLTLPADTLLTDLLNSRDFAKVDAFLMDNLGISLADAGMARMLPAAVANQITLSAAVKGVESYDPSASLDAEIQNLARLLGKRVGGLETVSFQIDMMTAQPLDRQAEQLVCTVESFDSLIVQSKGLTGAYYSQDLSLIEALMNGDGEDSACDYTPEEKYALITERNKAWMLKMPAIMKGGSTLFAVGAGHLVGGDGLLFMLIDAGYDVEPVEKSWYDKTE